MRPRRRLFVSGTNRGVAFYKNGDKKVRCRVVTELYTIVMNSNENMENVAVNDMV